LVSVPISITGTTAVPGIATTRSELLLKPERGYAYDVANGHVLLNAVPTTAAFGSD
jgi:hypothetical protein